MEKKMDPLSYVGGAPFCSLPHALSPLQQLLRLWQFVQHPSPPFPPLRNNSLFPPSRPFFYALTLYKKGSGKKGSLLFNAPASPYLLAGAMQPPHETLRGERRPRAAEYRGERHPNDGCLRVAYV